MGVLEDLALEALARPVAREGPPVPLQVQVDPPTVCADCGGPLDADGACVRDCAASRVVRRG